MSARDLREAICDMATWCNPSGDERGGRSGYDNEGEEFPCADGKLLYMGEENEELGDEAEEGDRYGAEPRLDGEVVVSEYNRDGLRLKYGCCALKPNGSGCEGLVCGSPTIPTNPEDGGRIVGEPEGSTVGAG